MSEFIQTFFHFIPLCIWKSGLFSDCNNTLVQLVGILSGAAEKRIFLLLLKILFSKMIVTAKIFSRAEIFSKSSEVVGHKSFFIFRDWGNARWIRVYLRHLLTSDHTADTIKPRHWLKHHKYSYNSWLLCGPRLATSQQRKKKKTFSEGRTEFATFLYIMNFENKSA